MVTSRTMGLCLIGITVYSTLAISVDGLYDLLGNREMLEEKRTEIRVLRLKQQLQDSPIVSSYPFSSDREIRGAVKLWQDDQHRAQEQYGSVSHWNVSLIQDFSRLFQNAVNFTEDLSFWDVSSARNMSRMFQNALSFHSNLSSWDTGHVLDFSHIFHNALLFNGDVSTWDVTGAFDLSFMFANAIAFQSNISLWTIPKQKEMGLQIRYAQNMESMFHNATSFHQDLSLWNTGTTTNMKSMFEGAIAFNSDLNDWNVGLVYNLDGMFRNARNFSGDLCWNILPSSSWEHMMEGSNGVVNVDCEQATVSHAASGTREHQHAKSDTNSRSFATLYLVGLSLAFSIGWSLGS